MADFRPSRHERAARLAHARAVLAIDRAFQFGDTPVKWPQMLQMLPNINVDKMPCGIFWFNDAEAIVDHTDQSDMIGYPVHQAVAMPKVEGDFIIPTEMLLMREIVADSMREQRPTEMVATLPELDIIEWVPEKVIDEKYPGFGFLQGAQTFIFWCECTRGLRM